MPTGVKMRRKSSRFKVSVACNHPLNWSFEEGGDSFMWGEEIFLGIV